MNRLSRGDGLALAGILTLATVLRLVGIRFGLPAVYNPDETAIMSRALAFATGDLNPHNFVYPTLYFYLLFGWIGAYGSMVLAVGRIDSIAALQRQFFTDPTDVFLAGRMLGVVCGVLSVAALVRAGEPSFRTPCSAGLGPLSRRCARRRSRRALREARRGRDAARRARAHGNRPCVAACERGWPPQDGSCSRRRRVRRGRFAPLLHGVLGASAGGGHLLPASARRSRRSPASPHGGRADRRFSVPRLFALHARRVEDGRPRHRGQPRNRRGSGAGRRRDGFRQRKPVSGHVVARRDRLAGRAAVWFWDS